MKNNDKVYADLMISNGNIATLDERGTMARAVAVKDGKILAVGSDEDVAQYKGPDTQVIDAGKRTVIPGLNDSHLHVIRGGLNYNMELRWDGVPSLADAMRMLKEQARRTPPGQWVRVVGGWSEFQFAERRMPTLEEINEAAPDTPVFVLHLYCRAMLNKAALRACGYTKDTPNPPGGEIQHDSEGLIVSVMHVHLGHHDCLEVLVVRGPADKVRGLADKLAAVRGVKHGRLTITTTDHKE